MKVQYQSLTKAFSQLPNKQRKYIQDAIRKSVNEGVALARSMAPVGSGPRDPEVGRFKDGIHSKFEVEAHAFVGSIEAAPAMRDAQVKAMSIEFGRQYKGGKKRQPKGREFRDTGRTDPVPVIRRTQSIIAPKHVGRIKRAINKAARELGLK